MPRPMFTPAAVWGLTLAAIASGACGSRGAPSPSRSASASAAASVQAPVASASAHRPKANAPAAPVPLTDEMKQFMALVTEDHKLSGALAKLGAPSLNDHGIGLDPMDAPRVVGTDPSAGDCYVVEGSDGPVTHTYLVCWQSGLIIQVADQGMK